MCIWCLPTEQVRYTNVHLVSRTTEQVNHRSVHLVSRTTEQVNHIIVHLVSRTTEQVNHKNVHLVSRTTELVDHRNVHLVSRTTEQTKFIMYSPFSHLFCRELMFNTCHLCLYTYVCAQHDFHVRWCWCRLRVTRQLSLMGQELQSPETAEFIPYYVVGSCCLIFMFLYSVF